MLIFLLFLLLFLACLCLLLFVVVYLLLFFFSVNKWSKCCFLCCCFSVRRLVEMLINVKDRLFLTDFYKNKLQLWARVFYSNNQRCVRFDHLKRYWSNLLRNSRNNTKNQLYDWSNDGAARAAHAMTHLRLFLWRSLPNQGVKFWRQRKPAAVHSLLLQHSISLEIFEKYYAVSSITFFKRASPAGSLQTTGVVWYTSKWNASILV